MNNNFEQKIIRMKSDLDRVRGQLSAYKQGRKKAIKKVQEYNPDVKTLDDASDLIKDYKKDLKKVRARLSALYKKALKIKESADE